MKLYPMYIEDFTLMNELNKKTKIFTKVKLEKVKSYRMKSNRSTSWPIHYNLMGSGNSHFQLVLLCFRNNEIKENGTPKRIVYYKCSFCCARFFISTYSNTFMA